MSSVTLKLLALFHHQVGLREVSYEGNTVGDVISKFIDEYRDKLDKVLYNPESKTLQKYILVLLNGRNIVFLDGFDTKLEDGDVIAISPPIAGG
ncbi:MAG: MoaD family protein [Candidatus Helarchaeota archaeon]|nr:MoaD family protein [Candidatus Helarchaeota archaeon]